MGRPLYSRTFPSTPAVRDPSPVCEKWSYLNAFDPDSDEFFANENTVYEDFVGPVSPMGPAEEEEDDLERDMLVVRMGNASPITSESSSLSDNESPLAAAAENRARLVVDGFHNIRQIEEGEPESALVEPAVHVRLPGRSLGAGSFPRRGFVTRSGIRTTHRPFTQREELLNIPPPSAPIPVPTLSRRSVDERVLLSPSTPPRQTPIHLAMSPPPTSTPRLYSWARNPIHSSSPSTGGPFTNPHARTSYTHLSPVLIRIRDVTV